MVDKPRMVYGTLYLLRKNITSLTKNQNGYVPLDSMVRLNPTAKKVSGAMRADPYLLPDKLVVRCTCHVRKIITRQK